MAGFKLSTLCSIGQESYHRTLYQMTITWVTVYRLYSVDSPVPLLSSPIATVTVTIKLHFTISIIKIPLSYVIKSYL